MFPFTEITANEYVGRRPATQDDDEFDKCDCAVNHREGPICNDETCLNVSSRKECVSCSKSRCQNRRIQSGKWKDVERFKVCGVACAVVPAVSCLARCVR